MSVEMAREDAAERAISEWKREAVAEDELGVGRLRGGDLEHARALVEARDLAREVTDEEACSAGDVERSGRGQRLKRSSKSRELLVPAWAVPFREAPGAEPPVVVLVRAGLVVRLHGSLE
jgi:hypothetical protein